MHQRSSTARLYALCIFLVLGAAVAWTVQADEPSRDAPAPTQVRDLDYGDVLFHFFQDDYFESIVRLEANRDFDRLQHHAAEAELLAGGLYLSLGLHTEAERIFDRLLAGPVAPAVRDRARFYLARIGYQRGYFEAALRNLELVEQPLAGKLEPERRLLEANVLMGLGRHGEAAKRLESWSDTSGWSNYARFNLGVALVRAGDTARGRQFLEQVGTMQATSEEQASLRDRANLALGFALLQQPGGDDPAAVLSRVRLDGPFTNKALLALGWAEANASRPDRALVPWLELQQRTTPRRVGAGVADRGSLCLCQAGLERPGVRALSIGGRRLCARVAAHRRVDRRDPAGRLSRLDPRHGSARATVQAGSGSSSSCPMRRTRVTSITCWHRTNSRKA